MKRANRSFRDTSSPRSVVKRANRSFRAPSSLDPTSGRSPSAPLPAAWTTLVRSASVFGGRGVRRRRPPRHRARGAAVRREKIKYGRRRCRRPPWKQSVARGRLRRPGRGGGGAQRERARRRAGEEEGIKRDKRAGDGGAWCIARLPPRPPPAKSTSRACFRPPRSSARARERCGLAREGRPHTYHSRPPGGHTHHSRPAL